MMNNQQAIAILIEAAGVAQSSGKLKLEDAALIVQAISFLKMSENAAKAVASNPLATKKSDATEVAATAVTAEPETTGPEVEA